MESSPISTATPIVFIVDDDVSVRESLERLISNEGWRAETFTSAQEFLDRPRVLVPSCLVLDIFLPGLNGLDLQKRVAAERADMPIIFITGYGDVPCSRNDSKSFSLIDCISVGVDRTRWNFEAPIGGWERQSRPLAK